MRKSASKTLALALSIAGLVLGPAVAPMPALAADLYVAPDAAAYSICNEHRVLTRIVNRFDYADRHLLHTGLAINDFSNIRLTRYKPQTERELIERFYCRAEANMTDQNQRPVWYLIESGMGYAGIVGDNVEFCVAGLDPLRVYGADCQSLR